jgi:hypothetical protein
MKPLDRGACVHHSEVRDALAAAPVQEVPGMPREPVDDGGRIDAGAFLSDCDPTAEGKAEQFERRDGDNRGETVAHCDAAQVLARVGQVFRAFRVTGAIASRTPSLTEPPCTNAKQNGSAAPSAEAQSGRAGSGSGGLRY